MPEVLVGYVDDHGSVQLPRKTQLPKGRRVMITILEDESYDNAGQLRPFGLCAGEFEVPDDFDVPLPTELLDLFEVE